MNALLNKIEKIGIVPVVVLEDANDALPLAQALIDGGIPCAEVTYRTEAAEESIRRITETYPDMIVGAGTVLTTQQVDTAVAAGAKFIVSPGLNPKVVKYCTEKQIPIIPGTSSPSDIEQALEFGLHVVKFFPAEASGGIKKIKAMAAPYTTVKFMPTGGINEGNINDYLSFSKVLACGGSWMVKNDLIQSGQFDKISQLTKETVLTMLKFELSHIEIYSENEKEAQAAMENFSVFAGNSVKTSYENYKDVKGVITFKTNNVERAIDYLKRKGIEFEDNDVLYDETHKIIDSYLKKDVCGFAVRLVQK